MNTPNLAIPVGARAGNSAIPSYNTSAFWEHLWRTSGIHSVIFAVIASALYGYEPQIAVVVAALAVLNLMWFAAALRTALADAGRDGWGAAATAASAATGGALLLLLTVSATIAHSIAVSGNALLTSGLSDFTWTTVVLSSFPRAMLIMAGTFGLWRAGLVSTRLFTAGVAAVVLVLLGGTTWMSDGFWAPNGAYSRFVSPAIGLLWVVVVSRVLLRQAPAARIGW